MATENIKPATDGESPASQNDTAEQKRLIAFFQRVSEAAHPHARRASQMFVLHLISACWVTYYVSLFFTAGLWFWIVLLIVLCLPALVLALLYMDLSSVVHLPERASSMGASLRTVSARFKDRLAKKTGKSEPMHVEKKTSLLKLGRMIIDLREVLFEVPGAIDLWGSITMLANPFFLMLTAIVVIFSACLTFMAFLTLMIHLL